MASLNKVQLIGRLGGDPESRALPSGETVCNFSLATSEQWKDKQTGERKEATEWHRIVMYGRIAQIASEYLRKGSQVYLEGKIKTRKWQDKETGADRYATDIQCFDMKMLGSRDENSGGRETNNAAPARSAAPRAAAPQQRPARQQQDLDDDTPF